MSLSCDAAALIEEDLDRDGASLRRLAGMSSVISPWKARDTASAFSSPVTRKTICLAERIVGSVIVTRSTKGSSPAGPLAARSILDERAAASRGRARRCDRPARARAASGRARRRRAPRRARARASGGGSSPRIRWISRGGCLEPVEQRLLREPVVRALVVRRHAPLVAPPERRRRPQSGCERRRPLVRTRPASSRR